MTTHCLHQYICLCGWVCHVAILHVDILLCTWSSCKNISLNYNFATISSHHLQAFVSSKHFNSISKIYRWIKHDSICGNYSNAGWKQLSLLSPFLKISQLFSAHMQKVFDAPVNANCNMWFCEVGFTQCKFKFSRSTKLKQQLLR